MPLKVYNTLTRKKEEFAPLDLPNVKMYVCGVTTYDECHLGHGRAYVVFDVIRRYLQYKNYQVKYIQNFTDVDDKIIKKSIAKNKKFDEIATEYTQSYFEVMDKLNIKRADFYPKASEHIQEMILLIKELIGRRFAYVIDNDVFFSVRKFNNYGKLSRKKIDELEKGARVEIDERKNDPLDFALWKKAKEGEPFWESPWGMGRPGWHIECSAMSMKYLGQSFDIHGGGNDLIFPHHENEIAQSEAAASLPFVKYWLHNGFVTINREKMSKSLGNFFTLKDIFQKFPPEVVRFLLISNHYRSPLDFSDQALEEAQRGLGRILNTIENINFPLTAYLPVPACPVLPVGRQAGRRQAGNLQLIAIEQITNERLVKFKKKFIEAMDDDFNTAKAVAVVFELVQFSSVISENLKDAKVLQEILFLFKEFGEVLGINLAVRKKEELPEEISKLIKEREKLRAEKKFKDADEIRKKLLEKGVILEDLPEGTRWKRSCERMIIRKDN